MDSPDGKRYMGYSMVTQRYHYVEWRPWDHASKTAGALVATELYDLQEDPQENVNVASRAENEELLLDLAAQLRGGFPAASLR